MTAAAELFVDGGSGFRVFPRNGINRRKSDAGGATRGPTPSPGAARGAPGHGVAPLVPVFDSSSDFWMLSGKIGTSVFVGSNSENISRTTFLKLKNTRKHGTGTWHLVNRLVSENV